MSEQGRFPICSECGWNLGVDHIEEGHVARGLPDDGMCPWCGEPIIDALHVVAIEQAIEEFEREGLEHAERWPAPSILTDEPWGAKVWLEAAIRLRTLLKGEKADGRS